MDSEFCPLRLAHCTRKCHDAAQINHRMLLILVVFVFRSWSGSVIGLCRKVRMFSGDKMKRESVCSVTLRILSKTTAKRVKKTDFVVRNCTRVP
jgi:hypothetical protein